VIERILSKLFKYEPIDGHGRCPVYMHRWTLFQPRWARWLWRGFGIYVHKFVADDWTRDLHDHPKRFISIGLAGSYLEVTREPVHPGKNPALWVYRSKREKFTAPWLRTFPATHAHRLELIDGRPCWTLVIVLRTVREWGFWAGPHRWVPWRQYVAPGNADADRSKGCP
jgi:hypothetical protein